MKMAVTRMILKLTLLSIAMAGTAPELWAQQIEEVVVTAQKREQSIQEIGISVTAFSGEQLKDLGIVNSTDLVAQTPGLTYVTPFGDGNNAAFTLRGVGLNDFSEHNESPTAVYVDQVYQASLAGLNFQMFDIERVEVLRGPQGTLYGRNTTGGLVHFITRKPTEEFNAYTDLTIGEYSEVRVEGGIGGALGNGVSGRLSAVYHNHDGYRDARTPGIDDANSRDVFSLRGQLLFQPSDDSSVLLSAHYSDANQIAATYEHTSTAFANDGITEIFLPANEVNPLCEGVGGLTGPGQDCFGYRDSNGDVYETDNDREPFLDLQTLGASATIDWNWQDIAFTSITAYEKVEKLFGEDTDMGPVPAIAVTNPVDSDQWSQELRAAGNAQRLSWTTGVYYFDRTIDTGSRTDVSGIDLVDDETVTSYDTKSWALFGQLEYDLTDEWSAILGARYTSEEQDFHMVARDLLGNTPLFLGLSDVPIPGFTVFEFTPETAGKLTEASLDDFNFRAELDWRPTDTALVYGSIAQGTKAPGFNFAIDGTGILGSSQIEQIPFDEEVLTSYELGLKSEIFGGKAIFNGAVFYYEYEDFQAFSFDQLTNVVTNKDAEVKGVEAELIARPIDGMDIRLGATWLDTEVKDIVAASFFTGEEVVRDREMVAAPDMEVTGMIRYSWNAGPGRIALQSDFRFVGDQFFDINNNPITAEDSYLVANASVGYEMADGRYSIVAWAKNFTDEEYRTYAIPVTSLGFTQNMIGQPRWYGVTFRANW
ncbi:MAG: TonB-dependent receptor [Woeseia sp.]